MAEIEMNVDLINIYSKVSKAFLDDITGKFLIEQAKALFFEQKQKENLATFDLLNKQIEEGKSNIQSQIEEHIGHLTEKDNVINDLNIKLRVFESNLNHLNDELKEHKEKLATAEKAHAESEEMNKSLFNELENYKAKFNDIKKSVIG